MDSSSPMMHLPSMHTWRQASTRQVAYQISMTRSPSFNFRVRSHTMFEGMQL